MANSTRLCAHRGSTETQPTGKHGWHSRLGHGQLVSNWSNTLLTIVAGLFIYWVLSNILGWALFRAIWTGENRDACSVEGAGACWPFVKAKFAQWIYGFYPIDQRWRVNICFFMGACGARSAPHAVDALQEVECLVFADRLPAAVAHPAYGRTFLIVLRGIHRRRLPACDGSGIIAALRVWHRRWN